MPSTFVNPNAPSMATKEGQNVVDDLLRTLVQDVATAIERLKNLGKQLDETTLRLESKIEAVADKIDEDRTSDRTRDTAIADIARTQKDMRETLTQWRPTVQFSSYWRRLFFYFIPPAALAILAAMSTDVWTAIKAFFHKQ